jgi:hypothetical protein
MSARIPERLGCASLFCIESQQRQVEHQGQPVSVDEEQESQEGMYGGFGDDVSVEAVAEVDRVDVVAGHI